MLFSRDGKGQDHCLSNVCTHRGNLLVDKAGIKRILTCSYHGRCFKSDGSFKSMPCFEDVENFPSKEDDLSQVPFGKRLNMFFVNLYPQQNFEDQISPILDRLSFLPLEDMIYDPEKSNDYELDANWMLYCENYLEGFHIPFVHPQLN